MRVLETVNRLLRKKDSEEFSNFILSLNDQELSTIPIKNIYQTLLEEFENPKAEKVIITEYIKILTHRINTPLKFIGNTSIFTLLRENIKNFDMRIACNCLEIIKTLVTCEPSVINKIGICSLISSFDNFPVIDQRIILNIIYTTSSEISVVNYLDYILDLCKLLTHHDQIIVELSVNIILSFKRYLCYANLGETIEVIPGVISHICVSLLVLNNAQLCMDLLGLMLDFAKRNAFILIKCLVKTPIDFLAIIHTNSSSAGIDKLRETLLRFAGQLLISLSTSQLTFPIYGSLTSSDASKLVNIALPLIFDSITNNKPTENSLFALSALMDYVQPDLTEIFPILFGCLNGQYRSKILIIFDKMQDKKLIDQDVATYIHNLNARDNELSRIKSILKDVNYVHNPSSDKRYLPFTSLEQLADSLNSVDLHKFKICDVFNRARVFLKEYVPCSKNSETEKNVINKLVKIAQNEFNSFIPEKDYNFFCEVNGMDFLKGCLLVNIIHQDQNIRSLVEISADFGSIEYAVNVHLENITDELVIYHVKNNPIFGDIIDIGTKITPSKGALLCRLMKIDGYVMFNFEVELGNSKSNFVFNDGIFRSLITSFGVITLKNSIPKIKLIPTNDDSGHTMTVPVNFSKFEFPISILDVSHLMKVIHEKWPDLNLESQNLANTYKHSSLCFANSICGIGMSSKFIYNMPYLFPLSFKLPFLKMITLDLSNGFKWKRRFFDGEKVQKNDVSNLSFKFIVDRNNVLNQGSNIFHYFARSMSHLDVRFSDDIGFGYGPTQEFFSIFSRELCSKPNLFRSLNGNLYPSPLANESDLYLLGLVFAKAFQTNYIVQVPVSEAFVKTARNEYVDICEVDETLSKSLSDHDGLIGLNFVYPGFEVSLTQDGESKEVNKENVNEFVEKIRDFTCGDYMKKKMKSFVSGFSEVIPWEFMSMLSPSEFIDTVSGIDKFDENDIRNSIEPGQGFHQNSPQFSQLLEVLLELDKKDRENFVKFVTGNPRLPFGGFSALNPKLTIAKKDPDVYGRNPDDVLPSVMTCANYLKIPCYSSKKIMKEKLLYAISECQYSFGLS